MSNLSDHAEKLILDWLLTAGTAVRPTDRYLAVFTSPTDDAGGGTELVGNGYARQTLTVGAASSPGGAASNTNEIIFTAAGASWGVTTHIGIYDAVSGGNLLWHGVMTAPVSVDDGQSLVFLVDSLDFTLT